MKLASLISFAIILIGINRCVANDAAFTPTCYITCGDRRNVEITELRVTKIVKYRNKMGKITDLSIEFTLQSNYDLEQTRKLYGASVFDFREPYSDKLGNHSYHAFLRHEQTLVNNGVFIYDGLLFLQKNTSDDDNYDRALDIIAKNGGLLLTPTMARMFTGLPSLIKFKPVILKLDTKQLEVKPDEWAE